LRTNSPVGAPIFKKEWAEFDKTAVKFTPNRGGKRKRTKRKYRKGKKTKKVKKSKKRTRK
jgi:hypothetical protein